MTGTVQLMANPARAWSLTGKPAANRGWKTLAPAVAGALAWLALTHACCFTGSMNAAERIGGFPICHSVKAF